MKPLLRTVAIVLSVLVLPWLVVSGSAAGSKPNQTTFKLVPSAQFLACLAQYPNDPRRLPSATVTVTRGRDNDRLRLQLANIKPNLQFDLFTIERSPLLANGQPDPSFAAKFNRSFGLAWYQSDIHVDRYGRADTHIRTILLDQIFGFDADAGVNLKPTPTFHVGFWFNDPQDAVACGFPPGASTPFNGEQRAGPLAMISLPSKESGLGPLCTSPQTVAGAVRCNP